MVSSEIADGRIARNSAEILCGFGIIVYLCSGFKNDLIMESLRKVIEVVDTPMKTKGGRPYIKRVEKILMPNGRFRYPVTYIDTSNEFHSIPIEDIVKDRVSACEVRIAITT